MRVIYKRTAVKDMEATRDYIAGRLKNPKAAKKAGDGTAESNIPAGG